MSDEQILERLLALNLERAEEEANAAKVKKLKTQRGPLGAPGRPTSLTALQNLLRRLLNGFGQLAGFDDNGIAAPTQHPAFDFHEAGER